MGYGWRWSTAGPALSPPASPRRKADFTLKFELRNVHSGDRLKPNGLPDTTYSSIPHIPRVSRLLAFDLCPTCAVLDTHYDFIFSFFNLRHRGQCASDLKAKGDIATSISAHRNAIDPHCACCVIFQKVVGVQILKSNKTSNMMMKSCCPP